VCLLIYKQYKWLGSKAYHIITFLNSQGKIYNSKEIIINTCFIKIINIKKRKIRKIRKKYFLFQYIYYHKRLLIQYSKIYPLSLPSQVLFFSLFLIINHCRFLSFYLFIFSFFENFRQKGQGDIEFIVVMMLKGCLAFGSREFSFFQIPVHAWSSSSCYFLVGPLLVSGVLKKIPNLFVIWHQHQFGFKRLYLSWNHSVIQVSKVRHHAKSVPMCLFLSCSLALLSLFFWIICCLLLSRTLTE
jgi:hypothetical protein